MPTRSSSPRTLAHWACLGCREAKRRCDRMLPECELCLQKNFACVYPQRRKRREVRGKHAETSQSPQQLPPLLNTPSPSQASTHSRDQPLDAHTPEKQQQQQQLHLAAERFLDPEVFQHAQLQLPGPPAADRLPLSDEVAAAVGSVADIHAAAQRYFATVHVWMPIVARIRFSKLLLRRLTHNRAELHLLLLAMRLSSDVVTAPRTALYGLTKRFQHAVEDAGSLSLLVLQAGVLVASYELGHGIYPAAFLSVAHCARYATALGVESSIGHEVDPKISTLDLEECRRVWWAVLALDRFMNLADPRRQLVTPDPDSSSYIPIDDKKWDAGTAGAENAQTIGSAGTLELGRFGRLAQAAHLLSLVLRAIAEGSTDTAQLRRTIFALVSVSRFEADTRRLELCTQMATCYSAILLLNHPTSFLDEAGRRRSLDPEPTLSAESSSVLEATLQMAARISDSFGLISGIISPFVLHVNYKAASIYIEKAIQEPDGKAAEYVAALKGSLKLFSKRWLVADAYLSLLERRETLLLLQQFST